MKVVHKLYILLWKELKTESRAKEVLTSMLVFSLLVVTTFGFALELPRDEVGKILPGLIWVTLIFAGLLGLNRSFVAEKQNDCLLGLMLCPIDRSLIYFAKTITNLVLMGIVELVSVPLFFIMFNYPMPQKTGLFLLILALGTYCFIAVGTFLSALAAGTRTSEILLPVLLIPLIIPVLLSAVLVTQHALGSSIAGVSLYLKLLATYAVIFTVLPALLFDYLLEV
ncbi:heme exporter protein CcmB [Desulfitobacterium sp.]|uniref:heme exporter protein CcmB n=1 Tax=Desulfitobacterium sp. TaxID=49981 RepID=UPI002B7992BF|nr:heme exporter protein CcmB [Desulfitobacterium sp.]HVJ47685.1 heme exporter protein CcmB [Desulfitobacterium sp.]